MGRVLRQYESTMYGNYRVAYCVYGAVMGALMALYVQVRHWMGVGVAAPSDLGKDVVMVVCIIAAGWLYRRGLKEKKVSFKELMLLGLGMGVIGGLIYGLYVWLYCGVMYKDVLDVWASAFEGEDSAERHMALHNAWNWALVYGFVQSAVTSIIVAFFGALIWRTEKSPVKERKSKKETEDNKK